MCASIITGVKKGGPMRSQRSLLNRVGSAASVHPCLPHHHRSPSLTPDPPLFFSLTPSHWTLASDILNPSGFCIKFTFDQIRTLPVFFHPIWNAASQPMKEPENSHPVSTHLQSLLSTQFTLLQPPQSNRQRKQTARETEETFEANPTKLTTRLNGAATRQVHSFYR